MSGVYLPNMEMPKSCGDCPYRKKLNPDENECMVDHHVYEETFGRLMSRRDENCPLVPAADVAEVRHGRWIKSPECPEEYDICSVCGKNDKHRSRGNWEHDMVESVPPYCKWCGAKMDGDEAAEGGRIRCR